VRAFLQYNAAFQIQVMNTCLEFLEPDWFRTNMPLCLRNVGGSLWLRRRRSSLLEATPNVGELRPGRANESVRRFLRAAAPSPRR